ncbi:MAG TPA: acyl-CoA dehydrogenase family protein [Candidatus Margulisiibacteriota bacterium]|nr:acyl-CoA dehydrogenase family protein [Candidatus Margulisiibacteriota bacterium]
MNFDFSDDQKLLRKTAHDFLSEHAPLSLCRAVLESDAPYSDTLWKSVAELGWLGTAIPEEYGGAGFGHLELAAIAEEIGHALAPIPFASSVYFATEAILLAGSPAQKQAYLPQLAAGARIGTFAHTEQAGEADLGSITAAFTNGTLTGIKWPVADGDTAHCAVVTARQGADTVLALVDLSARGVTRKPLRSIDPSRSLAELRFDATPAELLGDAASGAATVQKIMDRAAVLLAFEQLGGATRAFEITREYCLSRYAFGRPIASFQAIKHRLADLYVEIELARSNAYYGAWALSTDSPELPVAACGARASASDAFALASQEMIQLHGGVGYTWEFDCHLFYRRAKYLGALLGSAHQWREQLVQRLAAEEQ